KWSVLSETIKRKFLVIVLEVIEADNVKVKYDEITDWLLRLNTM
ncbi:11039_t:CDS:1, partial [Funneliformis mosseae]